MSTKGHMEKCHSNWATRNSQAHWSHSQSIQLFNLCTIYTTSVQQSIQLFNLYNKNQGCEAGTHVSSSGSNI